MLYSKEKQVWREKTKEKGVNKVSGRHGWLTSFSKFHISAFRITMKDVNFVIWYLPFQIRSVFGNTSVLIKTYVCKIHFFGVTYSYVLHTTIYMTVVKSLTKVFTNIFLLKGSCLPTFDPLFLVFLQNCNLLSALNNCLCFTETGGILT